MNTIKSTWLGWGILGLAGAGSYYFSKRSINADRAARYEAEREKQARLRRLERFEVVESTPKKPKAAAVAGANLAAGGAPNEKPNGKALDHASNPSSEASEEAAPVGHAPINADERLKHRSKYEAAEPYRSKKGDRFS